MDDFKDEPWEVSAKFYRSFCVEFARSLPAHRKQRASLGSSTCAQLPRSVGHGRDRVDPQFGGISHLLSPRSAASGRGRHHGQARRTVHHGWASIGTQPLLCSDPEVYRSLAFWSQCRAQGLLLASLALLCNVTARTLRPWTEDPAPEI